MTLEAVGVGNAAGSLSVGLDLGIFLVAAVALNVVQSR